MNTQVQPDSAYIYLDGSYRFNIGDKKHLTIREANKELESAGFNSQERAQYLLILTKEIKK